MEENIDSNSHCPKCGKLIVRDYGMPDIVQIDGKPLNAKTTIPFELFKCLFSFSGIAYHRNCFTCTRCGESNIELAAYKSIKGSSYFYCKECWDSSGEKAGIVRSPRYIELL